MSKPKYIRCNECGYKERKKIRQLDVTDDMKGLEAVFVSTCRACSAQTVLPVGDQEAARVYLDYLRGIMNKPAIEGSQSKLTMK